MPHRPAFGPADRTAQLTHDELQEKQRGFSRLLVLGKIGEDAPLLLAAEWRIGHDHVHAVFVADLAQRETQGVFRVNVRVFQAVKQEVHLAEKIGQRLGLNAKESAVLQMVVVFRLLALLLEVLECFDQEIRLCRPPDRARFPQGAD